MTSSPLVVGDEPMFWMTMEYRCDQAEFGTARYLEVGCEGGGVDDETRMEKPPPDIPGLRDPDIEVEVKYTATGRRVVPVPYVAGHCPDGHQMSHREWHHDRQLPAHIPASQIPPTQNLESGAPSVFIFRYPPDTATKPMACGIPSEWFPDMGFSITETVVHHRVDPETGCWVERIGE